MNTKTDISRLFFISVMLLALVAFGGAVNAQTKPGGGTSSDWDDFFESTEKKSDEKTSVVDRKQAEKAILEAVKNENRKELIELIKKDYTLINTVDDELGGQTLVHWAVMAKTADVLKCLIEWDADLEKQNKNGQTPLNIAVKAKNIEAVRYLISNGAKRSVTDEELQELPLIRFDKSKYLVEKSEEVKRRIAEAERKRLEEAKQMEKVRVEKEKQTEKERLEQEKQRATLAAKQKAEEEARRRQESEKLKADLANPEKLIEPLRELKRDDLSARIDAFRRVKLVLYADVAQDNALYSQAKKDLFACLLPNFRKGEDRIGWVSDILPSMIRRKDFEGLKECTDDIVTDMVPADKNDWAWNCSTLAGFALAMGDGDAAISRINSGYSVGGVNRDTIAKRAIAVADKRMFAKDGKLCVDNVELVNYEKALRYPRKYLQALASVNEITWGEGFSFPCDIWESETHMFCSVATWLAIYDKKDEYYKFLSMANKTYKPAKINFAAFHFAQAEAMLGDFDRARNHWMQYPKDTGPWPLWLLSFIIRQEFLTGEFKGWETMQSDNNNILKLRGLVYKGTDMSSYIPAFYFDYGRGLARHKTTEEIASEWKTFAEKFGADGKYGQADFAFFKAGLATGLQDRKNSEKRPKQ